MSNHGHLLLTPPERESLSRLMKAVLQRYAQYRNRQRRASGKLFEQRFHCVTIETESQLAATTAYVELNPERACIGSAAAYRWTTFRLHAGGCEPVLGSLWTPSRWYLALGHMREQRQRAYLDWIESRRTASDAFPHPRSIDPPQPTDALRVERPDRTRAR
jgi:putative transposase